MNTKDILNLAYEASQAAYELINRFIDAGKNPKDAVHAIKNIKPIEPDQEASINAGVRERLEALRPPEEAPESSEK